MKVVEVLAPIIVAIFASTGFWSWLSNIKLAKQSSTEAVLSTLMNVEDEVLDLKADVGSLRKDVQTVKEETAEERAVTARVRILRFCDELQEGRKHSKDSFDQVMTDITTYEKYCEEHKDFKNNQTEQTRNTSRRTIRNGCRNEISCERRKQND